MQELKIDWLIEIANEVFKSDAKLIKNKRPNVWARRAIYAINVYDQTSTALGQYFNQDHSTVLHAIKKHENGIVWDKEYRNLYKQFYENAMRRNFIELIYQNAS
jgi:chromosomal replication initiation ATPase DnaA